MTLVLERVIHGAGGETTMGRRLRKKADGVRRSNMHGACQIHLCLTLLGELFVVPIPSIWWRTCGFEGARREDFSLEHSRRLGILMWRLSWLKLQWMETVQC